MPITQEHELHQRRFSRNLGLGVVLAGLVALVFALTVVKVENMNMPMAVPAGTPNSADSVPAGTPDSAIPVPAGTVVSVPDGTRP